MLLTGVILWYSNPKEDKWTLLALAVFIISISIAQVWDISLRTEREARETQVEEQLERQGRHLGDGKCKRQLSFNLYRGA
jgi:hypothetical protein